MNIVQKILANHVEREVKPGEIITVSVDLAMIHDYFAPHCFSQFKNMGFTEVWDPSKILLIADHEIPPASVEESESMKQMRSFAERYGIKLVIGEGVSHRVMPEMGLIVPGEIVIGTDSHTCTAGALGAFATGVGYTDMAAVLGRGKIWLKVPQTLKFEINGKLPDGVYAKDLILKIIGDIGADGATYKAMEFSGSTVKEMSMDGRFTLCNMAVEAGAKTGMVEPDKVTLEYLSGKTRKEIKRIRGDGDGYEKIYQYCAEEIEPMIACPHSVDNVKPVREVEGTKIDEAFIGSCTTGLEDLRIAAEILEGNEVHPDVRLIVTPPTRRIYMEALKEEIIEILIEAGAIITHPSCSLCAGSKSGGIIADGERVITTTNRNYLGRLGGRNSEAFLASAATVAYSAIYGEIKSPW
ncbi:MULTISPECIES: 3-isopropylmalate dehydratase large subunit [unclassified Archaeoglobus]|jgi:3-isopropylmalate/(R)-2-methylmalate dehydratase large subunit|uniref:3-isopropylmalate dehydratase large subunit n=1 Tax=unclassified Archaeoglobus TaxID=2643606 RepID=UPI0025B8D0A4|nr:MULTISPECIES: 3-isopropylmalate dehydratase large subunit [unclassified Archaeoglobus]